MKCPEIKIIWNIKQKWESEIWKKTKKRIIINDNDYSNACDKSNDNKKIKEWITKTITLLL